MFSTPTKRLNHVLLRVFAIVLAVACLITSMQGSFVLKVEAANPTVVLPPNYAGGYGGGFTNGGIKGDYFNNTTLTGSPSFTRTDNRIDFDWGNNAPGGSNSNEYKSVGADHYSVRWTGVVIPKFSKEYTFMTTSDAGVRLVIKDVADSTWTTLINNWNTHVSVQDTGKILLVSGKKYDIKMEYYETTRVAVAKLKWTSDSVPEEVIDPISGMGLNCTDWGTTFTDIVKCARNGWENVYGKATPTMGLNGWTQGDGSYVFQESLNQGLDIDPLMRGTVCFSFKGKVDISFLFQSKC